MAKTQAVQQTEVGDGLALGVLAVGVDSVPRDKMAIELAFRRAWRKWPHASTYPAIKAGPSFDDIYIQILLRSERRRWGCTVWRNEGNRLYPELVGESWTFEDGMELHVRASGVPEAGWRQLAELFLDSLHGSGDAR
ncbi:hypothetical protein ACWD5Z_27995 [Micromonospora chokoriensis]